MREVYVDNNNFMLIKHDFKIGSRLSEAKSLSAVVCSLFDSMGLHFGSGLAIDLGAYIGDSTSYFLDAGYDVIAVEADPIHFKCLEHNCPASANIHALISDTSGSSHCRLKYEDSTQRNGAHINPGSLMWTDTNGDVGSKKVNTNEFYSYTIDSLTLDDITSDVEKCHVIKMDIQGFEIEAIKGGLNFFRRCKPIIATELDPLCLKRRNYKPEDLITAITNLGYRLVKQFKHDVLFVPNA